MELAFSQACENNKHAISSILQNAFASTKQVLEIGSGTGQHASLFAENLPHLRWQTSDLPINHYAINQRIVSSELDNITPPFVLDLNTEWNIPNNNTSVQLDGIFTANTLHIVSWPLVKRFFEGVKRHLAMHGTLCIYGPFNYNGKFTSASNANFELWLKDIDENSGIRDFEAIIQLACFAGLTLINDHTMPANNRLLEFIKSR
jgi:cyclopropane fatty-acyl-phospholipid synthase-like methyltransferase